MMKASSSLDLSLFLVLSLLSLQSNSLNQVDYSIIIIIIVYYANRSQYKTCVQSIEHKN